MNHNIIKVGKSCLAAVLAASMSFGVCSELFVLANDETIQEDVVDEVVKEGSVEEETGEKEKIEEVVEESTVEVPNKVQVAKAVPGVTIPSLSNNVALGKTVTTSGNELPTFAGGNLVDGSGDSSSRWSSSVNSGPHWVQIDLGSVYDLSGANLYWESGKANAYSLQVSTDQSSWNTVYTNSTHPASITENITFNTTKARYVKLYINSISTKDPLNRVPDWNTVSLYEIQVLAKVEAVSKDELQTLYDEVIATKFEYLPKNYFTYAYNLAKKKANEVLLNENATADDVKKAKDDLYMEHQKHLLKEKAAHYLPRGYVSSDKEFGYFDEEYQKYTTESCLGLINAAGTAWINASYGDLDNLKKHSDAIDVAYSKLALFDETQGGSHGIPKYTIISADGTISITQETVVENNERFVRLHLTFTNDGIDPFTGKQSDKGKFSKKSVSEGKFVYTVNNRMSYVRDIQPLNGDFANGATGTLDVKEGLPADFEFKFSARDNYGSYENVIMPGLYRVNDVIPSANKEALQNLYDQAITFKPQYIGTPEKDSTMTAFNKALTKAKSQLDDPLATQENVDSAFRSLDSRYALVKANDLTWKFSPKQNFMDYNAYTTDSITPLMRVYLEAYNHMNTNYDRIQDIENLKRWYNEYLEAEKGLVEYKGEAGVWSGLNPNMVSETKKHVGHFVVTEKMNAQKKLVLHVEYVNDGIHPISGTVYQSLKDKDLKRLSAFIEGTDSTGKEYFKNLLNDNFTYTKEGLSFEIELLPGTYSFRLGSYSDKIASVGSYNTGTMMELNEVPVIQAENVTLTVDDVYDPLKNVTATDAEDGDLTNAIKVIENTVDTSKVGTYKVTYQVSDLNGAVVTKTIEVTVNPKMEVINSAPKIDAKDITITAGESFDPLEGVTATDAEDGDLTDKIKVTINNVSNSRSMYASRLICITEPGTYEVIYEVTDSQGATATKTIRLTVNPKMEVINSAPKIDAKDVTLMVGDKYDPLKGVSATDAEDGDLTNKIVVVENPVDTSKAGKYVVVLEVKDSAGARVVKYVNVEVKEKKETPKKDQSTNTGVRTQSFLYTSLAAIAGSILVVLKKRKK